MLIFSILLGKKWQVNLGDAEFFSYIKDVPLYPPCLYRDPQIYSHIKIWVNLGGKIRESLDHLILIILALITPSISM
jgi:hypothetical protein